MTQTRHGDPVPDQAFRVTVVGSEVGFEAAEGEPLLDAARRAGVWLPFECGWGSCGTCKATLVDGATELLFPGAPAVDARDERRRRILLCQSAATTDVTIKPLRVADAPTEQRPTRDVSGVLTEREEVGPGIGRFRFALADSTGAPVTAVFRPGQYAVLGLASGLRRCYSMAGLPGDDHVEFVAKRYTGGPGSERLHGLRVGDSVPMQLPYGDMWLRDGDAPVLLVAGGTGISAVLSMLRELALAAAPRARVDVVYGAATKAELVYADEVARLVGTIPGARLHEALSSPPPGWTGTAGFVTDALGPVLADLAPESSPTVYLAGPPPMVRAVGEVLDAAGVQRDRRFVDSFG